VVDASTSLDRALGDETPTTADPTPSWHAMPAAAVEALLETGGLGLAHATADARLAHYGPNRLAREPPPRWAVVLARQFRSPLIYILVAALAVTLLLGEHLDAGVIAVVLLLNGVIGFTQERKAETAVRALMGLVVPHAHVIRGGQESEVDTSDLVPGDLVVLEPGARVPADLRLVAVNGLQVDESLLTGGSSPVGKQVGPGAPNLPLADRSCMAYTDSMITVGRARGVVVATGDGTELGAIADLMRKEVVPRPSSSSAWIGSAR